MKKMYYKVFKPKIWKRFSALKWKQSTRLQAVKEARQHINENTEIPFSWLRGRISKILHFPEGEYASQELMTALTLTGVWMDDVLARAIPLSWFDKINK